VNNDRRHLLQLAAACSTTHWLPRSAWAQPKFAGNPFTLGVASGSPTHEGVVLWTRLLPAPPQAATVRWEIADDDAFAHIVRSGVAQAQPELAHAVHVEVEGLASDRWYFYRFFAGNERSPVGRTRTFPAPDAPASRLRLTYASCQRWEHGYFSAWRHMAEELLDAVLFLGDYIYEYPGARDGVREVPGGTWVLTLDDYRQRYALYKAEPELQAMHAACPWLVTWDDHEVQNDYAGLTTGENGPPVWSFARRRAAAYQAFYEHMPLRASVLTRALSGLLQAAELRLYSQVRFGTLASLVMLDDRQYRDAQVCTRDGAPGSSRFEPAACAAWSDPKRTLLGAAQEAWLGTALAQGGAAWQVLGQQTVFGVRDYAAGDAKPVLWNDGWDGYPAARTRLLEQVRRHDVRNLVLLGGDVHAHWVGHVKADYADARSANVGVEFCGTSITSRGGNDRLSPRHPHFIHADGSRRGYGVCEFTPQRLTTTLRAVSDVARRDASIETQARFVVEAGRAVVERA
jgi:alkaline phosphatase D